MKLIKVKDGLLEVDNFYLTSSFSDFAGSENITRDITKGKLKLISNNKIERKFIYDEFVLEIKKEDMNLQKNDYSILYLGNKDRYLGIKENENSEQNEYWKVLKSGNYIQAYSSQDGINYINIGGMKLDEMLESQGFAKESDDPLILSNYKIYANPYVTIQNFSQGTLCELYDINNKLLKTRVFDGNLECKVFLDGNMEGYLVFKDKQSVEIYKSGVLNLSYGDVYIFSPYNFEVIYHGTIVNNTNIPLLHDLEELITIKNVGSKDYTDVTIETQTRSNDLIQLSLDGVNYADTVTIDIKRSESKDIFVKIVKNVNNHNFNVRDFQLVING